MAKKAGRAAPWRYRREESLGYLVNYLGRVLARALERRLLKHGVPLGQFPLLLTLWEEESLTQSEIARRLDIEQPTVANTLRRMERDGLVRAEPDPSHRRQVLIKLTEKGRKLERPLKLEALAVNQAAAAKISPSDLDTFRQTIRLLLETLEERADV
ncbi:MAG TPA: MarR family transcriptional regulator [Roseiarcus sp.]|nr:MarR family transcriptional regulator [Roseiarcus sp.]